MRRVFVSLAVLAMGAQAHASEGQPTAAPAAQPEKLICKREGKTGSLVQRRKACMTATQWREAADRGRAEAERSQEHRLRHAVGLPSGG